MNRRRRLEDAAGKLSAGDRRVGTLHAGMDKEERKTALLRFRRGKTDVLVVSGVAARGLDVEGCDCVVNLETASDARGYAHRAGRAGRAGRPGVVLSVVPPREAFVLRKFGRSLGVQIPEGQLREGELSAGGEALLCPPGAEAAEAT